MDSENVDYDVELGDGPENKQTFQRWSRPALPSLDPRKDPVVFQQIDIDHYTGTVMNGMPGSQVSLSNYCCF